MLTGKKSRLAIALGGALALLGHAQAAEIKIGVAGPLSGSVAQYGDMQFTGTRIAIEQINQAGGINGDKLVAIEYDDACDPKQAVAVANKVVNDGVKYVIGHLCSASTQPASDVYQDEGILMITPASTSPTITEQGYNLVMRTIGLDSDQGPTAAKYIINKVKPQRVAVIHDKQQYGEGIASSVKKSLEAAGISVVAFEGITSGDKDFSALIAKLKKDQVDFVYYGGYHPELGLILRQAHSAGLKATFMGPEGVGNKEISSIAGAASEGLLVTLPKKYDQDPANLPVVNALKAKNLDSTGPFVWTSYAATQAIVEGIKRAGSDDPEAIAKALRSAPVNTVMGPLHWNAKGDLDGFEFGVFEWHADGSSSMK
ncbi:MAG: branched-chain amino acid ABC transporter substrate-binding protein [Plesiomonas sp.]